MFAIPFISIHKMLIPFICLLVGSLLSGEVNAAATYKLPTSVVNGAFATSDVRNIFTNTKLRFYPNGVFLNNPGLRVNNFSGSSAHSRFHRDLDNLSSSRQYSSPHGLSSPFHSSDYYGHGQTLHARGFSSDHHGRRSSFPFGATHMFNGELLKKTSILSSILRSTVGSSTSVGNHGIDGTTSRNPATSRSCSNVPPKNAVLNGYPRICYYNLGRNGHFMFNDSSGIYTFVPCLAREREEKRRRREQQQIDEGVYLRTQNLRAEQQRRMVGDSIPRRPLWSEKREKKAGFDNEYEQREATRAGRGGQKEPTTYRSNDASGGRRAYCTGIDGIHDGPCVRSSDHSCMYPTSEAGRTGHLTLRKRIASPEELEGTTSRSERPRRSLAWAGASFTKDKLTPIYTNGLKMDFPVGTEEKAVFSKLWDHFIWNSHILRYGTVPRNIDDTQQSQIESDYFFDLDANQPMWDPLFVPNKVHHLREGVSFSNEQPPVFIEPSPEITNIDEIPWDEIQLPMMVIEDHPASNASRKTQLQAHINTLPIEKSTDMRGDIRTTNLTGGSNHELLVEGEVDPTNPAASSFDLTDPWNTDELARFMFQSRSELNRFQQPTVFQRATAVVDDGEAHDSGLSKPTLDYGTSPRSNSWSAVTSFFSALGGQHQTGMDAQSNVSSVPTKDKPVEPQIRSLALKKEWQANVIDPSKIVPVSATSNVKQKWLFRQDPEGITITLKTNTDNLIEQQNAKIVGLKMRVKTENYAEIRISIKKSGAAAENVISHSNNSNTVLNESTIVMPTPVTMFNKNSTVVDRDIPTPSAAFLMSERSIRESQSPRGYSNVAATAPPVGLSTPIAMSGSLAGFSTGSGLPSGAFGNALPSGASGNAMQSGSSGLRASFSAGSRAGMHSIPIIPGVIPSRGSDGESNGVSSNEPGQLVLDFNFYNGDMSVETLNRMTDCVHVVIGSRVKAEINKKSMESSKGLVQALSLYLKDLYGVEVTKMEEI